MNLAILFDLDGTLADTARDLGGALNRLLIEEGQAPLPHAALRPLVSGGARALLQRGFNLTPASADYLAFQQRFLALYKANLCQETILFAGIAELLDTLDARVIPWGIVTNKSQRFTLDLVEALGLRQRCACLVSGDTAPRSKPDAMPMLLASQLIGSDPAQTLYLGDDLRDIQAGKAAGMITAAAAYGYVGEDLAVSDWGADHIIETPQELLALL